MAPRQRPELTIKVYPEDQVQKHHLDVLQKLRQTNALILHLEESVKGNVINTPYPYITFKRVSSSDKLPENLKLDGDPLSDFFVTLKDYCGANSRSSTGSSDLRVVMSL